jgi:hypothetical protein
MRSSNTVLPASGTYRTLGTHCPARSEGKCIEMYKIGTNSEAVSLAMLAAPDV